MGQLTHPWETIHPIPMAILVSNTQSYFCHAQLHNCQLCVQIWDSEIMIYLFWSLYPLHYFPIFALSHEELFLASYVRSTTAVMKPLPGNVS